MKGLIRYMGIIAALLAVMVQSTACHDRKKGKDDEKDRQNVMILYFAGFNNLSSYMRTNVTDLLKGTLPGQKNSDDVILLFAKNNPGDSKSSYPSDTSPYLIRIYKDKTGTAVLDTVKTYPAGTSAASTSTMREVLNYVAQEYPAKSYGMIFSSHASGWLPSGYYGKHYKDYEGPYQWESIEEEDGASADGLVTVPNDEGEPLVKSIGSDYYSYSSTSHQEYQMELCDFAAAIPIHLDYLIFDACFMGGVETAYELRNVATYVVGCPTEVLAQGMIYEKIPSHLLCLNPDVKAVCQDYFDYYNAFSDDSANKSATVTLVKTDGMENLASVCKDLVDKYRKGIEGIDASTVQGFFRYNDHWFYDLYDIFDKAGASAEDLATLQTALYQCIAYKAYTPMFLKKFSIDTCCGLTMYLPAKGSTVLDNTYKDLAWNKATGLVNQ